jgi:transcriptional regulator with XRE-family HTH domain
MWRRFGAELRKLRTQAGMSQGDMAREVALSRSMLSAIERGARAPKKDHAELADRALDTGGTLSRLWLSISERQGVPDWFVDVLALERQAEQIRAYHNALIPGLLHTADYARAILKFGRPWDGPEDVERLVVARISRLDALLRENKPLLWFVVDEHTLRHGIGSRAVMRGQLEHLVSLVEDEHVRLHVIPQTVMQHPGRSGPFRTMSFRQRRPVTYIEHLLGGELIDDPHVVQQCDVVFGALQAEALSPSASTRLLRDILEEL